MPTLADLKHALKTQDADNGETTYNTFVQGFTDYDDSSDSSPIAVDFVAVVADVSGEPDVNVAANFVSTAGATVAATFVSTAGATVAANFVSTAGATVAANFVSTAGATVAATFVSTVGATVAANFVSTAGATVAANFVKAVTKIDPADSSSTVVSPETAGEFVKSAGTKNSENPAENNAAVFVNAVGAAEAATFVSAFNKVDPDNSTKTVPAPELAGEIVLGARCGVQQGWWTSGNLITPAAAPAAEEAAAPAAGT